MKQAWTIAKRDFKTYFTSPIAYIVIAAFLSIMGFMYFNFIQWFIEQTRGFQGMNNNRMTTTTGIIQPLYQNMNVVLLFLIPFITMRLFAEERKNHTIELLMTSPVRLYELVLGKFLSAILLLSVMMGITFAYPMITASVGTIEWGPTFTNILGTYLMAGSFISIGVLFSATTENQIVAGALTFASALLFWLLAWFAHSAGTGIGDFIVKLSLIDHYKSFSQGVLDSSDLVYFLSFIGIGLFLTHRVLDSYRWR